MYLFSDYPIGYSIDCAEDEIIAVYRYDFPATQYSDYQSLSVISVIDAYEFKRMLDNGTISEHNGQYSLESYRDFNQDADANLNSLPLTDYGARLLDQGIYPTDIIDPDWWIAETIDLYTRDQFIERFAIQCNFT